MSEHIIIYHNGQCSKSKGALELLQEGCVPHNIRWYLTDPLTEAELTALLARLQMRPHELVRKNEPLYEERYEGRALTDAEWLDALVQHPELIERPVVALGERALVARPAERIWELVEHSKNT